MSTDAASPRLTFGASDRPYAPGWINRLTWWIDRVPGPSWLVFAAMLALTGGITFGQGLLGRFGARTSVGTIGALHRSVDSGDLADADALNKTLASLVTEREVLDRLPTWPWRPGTLGAFATAIGLPIVLFLITRFLDRLV